MMLATMLTNATPTVRKERVYSESDMRNGLGMMLSHSRVLAPDECASPAAVAKFFNQPTMEDKARAAPRTSARRALSLNHRAKSDSLWRE